MAKNSKDYQKHLRYYRSQHKTLGCKITHLFGIPMIFISLPLLVFDWRKSLVLFSLGWILQFIGHYVFEKNSPVLLTKKARAATIFSALFYALDNWIDTVKSIAKVIKSATNSKAENK